MFQFKKKKKNLLLTWWWHAAAMLGATLRLEKFCLFSSRTCSLMLRELTFWWVLRLWSVTYACLERQLLWDSFWMLKRHVLWDEGSRADFLKILLLWASLTILNLVKHSEIHKIRSRLHQRGNAFALVLMDFTWDKQRAKCGVLLTVLSVKINCQVFNKLISFHLSLH